MEEHPAPGEVTQLLIDWRHGKQEAGEEIITLLYRELERMAGSYLRNERSGHTLEPAGLVNELYLRMIKGQAVPYQDRAHFFAVAARQLRRILVDYARKRKGRGEARFFVTLSGLEESSASIKDEDLEALEEAMNELENLDERAHKAAELVRLKDITHIVHLAAVLMPSCQKDPVGGAMINVVGTLNVFEAARKSGRDIRVSYASSSAVWGPPSNYPGRLLNESDPLLPA